MSGVVLGAALAVVVGLSLWLAVPVDAPSPAGARAGDPGAAPAAAGSRTSALATRVAALEARLGEEIAARERLAARLQRLEGDAPGPVERFLAPLVARDASGASEATDASGELAAGTAAQEPETAPADAAPRALEVALLEAGIAPETVESLRRRVAGNEMARLYLRDRAVREGWLDTPEYRDELAALQASPESLRSEFGDEVYDRYLYATGQPNRVVVNDTFVDSPAAAAGIRAGDVLLRYAGGSVFSVRELQEATSAGSPGEAVGVELIRDGVVLYTAVPRGPLGVRLEVERQAP